MTESLAEALALLQKDLPQIAKEHTATVRSDKGNYSYDYADLSDVSDAIMPKLSEVGLSWICLPTLNDSGRFVLRYELLHTSGQSRTGEYPIGAKENSTPQTVGGLITYARRYALCAATGVAPKGDDDDAQAAPKPTTAQRKSRPQQQQPAALPPSQRTAQRARVDGPPLPGDEPTDDKVTPTQLGKLGALFSEAGVTDREARLASVRRILDKPALLSSKDLTKKEASTLIEKLQTDGVPDLGDWPDPRLDDAPAGQSALGAALAKDST